MPPREIIKYRGCEIVVSLWVRKWLINYIRVPSGTVYVKPFLKLEFLTKELALEKGKSMVDKAAEIAR